MKIQIKNFQPDGNISVSPKAGHQVGVILTVALSLRKKKNRVLGVRKKTMMLRSQY